MERTETRVPGFTIRHARKEDAGLILSLIRGLAEYEKMADAVETDVETLQKNLFERNQAQVIIGEAAGEAVGFALYFYNFSTFQGKHGLYLEDLFIRPEHRGRGYGSAMLAWLAKKAQEEDCGRFEWICLDWNAPALKVYRAIGAVPLEGWTIQRLTGEALSHLAEQAAPRE